MSNQTTIPLSALPARVSPGQAYFQCRKKNRSKQEDRKGKGKQRAHDSTLYHADSTLEELLEPVDSASSSLFQKLQQNAGRTYGINNAAAFTTQPDEPQVLLCCDNEPSPSTSTSSSLVEELAWSGSTLVWSKGSAIYRIYSFSEDPDDKQDIHSAMFAYFEIPAPPSPQAETASSSSTASTSSSPPPLTNGTSSPTLSSTTDEDLFGPFHSSKPPPPWSDDNANATAAQQAAATLVSVQKVRVLAILFQEELRLYYPTGEHHVVPIGVPVLNMWALDRGILLEKRSEPKLQVPKWLSMSAASSSTNAQEPTFYTLLDPFGDVRPVAKTSGILYIPPPHPKDVLSARKQTSLSSHSIHKPFIDNNERIVFISDRRDSTEPLAVTVNTKTAKLSIWAYAQIVERPEDIVNGFRQEQRAQTDEDLNGTFAQSHRENGHVTVAPNRPAIGKRRRSSDERGDAVPPSSDMDLPASTAPSQDSEHRPFGHTAAQRRVPALLDRRKSQHNPDATVAELLGGVAPAAKPGQAYSSGPAQDRARRRTSVLKSVTSTGMDRRQSTTRNELSVSLDRMALGASNMPPHSQLSSQQSQSAHSAAPVEPGQLAPHDRQERFEALVGHGEMERDASMLAEHSLEDPQSDIFITRLYSTQLPSLSIDRLAEIQARTFHTADEATTLAILVPDQHSLTLFHILRTHVSGGSKLVCSPVQQFDSVSIATVNATRPHVRDLITLDSRGQLSLVILDCQVLLLSPPSTEIGLRVREAGNDCVDIIHVEQSSTRLATSLRTDIPIIDYVLKTLSHILRPTYASFLTVFWRVLRQATALSIQSALSALQVALLGSSDSIAGAANGIHPESVQSDWEWVMKRSKGGNASPTQHEQIFTGLSNHYLAISLHALHLLTEESKLFVSRQADIALLAPLRAALAARLGALDYVDAAVRDGAALGSALSTAKDTDPQLISLLPPFDVYDALANSLSGSLQARDPLQDLEALMLSTYPKQASLTNVRDICFKALREVLSIYQLFRGDNLLERATNIAENILLTCAARGMTCEDLNSLMPAVGLPIREAIRQCQLHAASTWPKRAYALLDRADQMAMKKGPTSGRRREPISMKKRTQYAHDVICDANKNLKPISHPQHLPKRKTKDKATRFSLDHRLEDVQRMLNYTSSLEVKFPKGIDPTEAELPAAQQDFLVSLAKRTLALPVGHAMFFYRATARPRSMGISIPKVELSAKIVPSVSYLAPSADGLAPEEKTWPYFHSGVATALHIAWSKEEFDASEYAFHRPAELNARHGGFLLGLGLTGQIRSLGTYQAFKYLDPKHEYTSIGLLLGLGASYMGTADPKVSSTLSVHTSALHPPTAAPLNVSLSLQASGLVAMGLVHVASRNRGIADNILRDLTRIHITGTEHPDGCLEAYAIASGFSYGLVMLGKGNEYSGPSDANILSTFKYLLEGGRGTHLPGAKRNVEGVLDAAITSPAATIALALTFLRTNRRAVADLLEIPQTIDRLDHVRNDLVLLRSACRLLIMWDGLRCTKTSVESLVPAFMQQSTQQREQLKSPVPSDAEVAYWHVIAGACLALGLKYAGSAKVEAHSVMIEYLDKLARKTASITVTSSLRSKLASRSLQNCVNTITLALASVMAGTGELNVLRRLRVMHGHVKESVSYGTHMVTHMALGLLFLGKGRFTLGTSKVATAALLCAFYPVFPQTPSSNRFHLQAFRHMWVLAVEPRCLLAKDVDSGKPVYLRLKFKLREETVVGQEAQVTSKHLTAPTLTPSLSTISSIQSDSPRYWPVTLDFENVKDHLHAFVHNQTIFVKRKAGHLSYAQDPRGIRSVFTQPKSEAASSVFDNGKLVELTASDRNHVLNLIASFQSFSPTSRHDLRIFGAAEQDDLVATIRTSTFMMSVVMETLVQDKTEAIGLYRALYQAFKTTSSSPAADVQALLFVRHFYEDDVYGRLFGQRRQSLIRRDFIEDAYVRSGKAAVNLLGTGEQTENVVRIGVVQYLGTSARLGDGPLDDYHASLVRQVLAFLQVPLLSHVREVQRKVMELRQTQVRNQAVLATILPLILTRLLHALEDHTLTLSSSSEQCLVGILAELCSASL